jgi:hypothetical protein
LKTKWNALNKEKKEREAKIMTDQKTLATLQGMTTPSTKDQVKKG